jgi:hypothetical protein
VGTGRLADPLRRFGGLYASPVRKITYGIALTALLATALTGWGGSLANGTSSSVPRSLSGPQVSSYVTGYNYGVRHLNGYNSRGPDRNKHPAISRAAAVNFCIYWGVRPATSRASGPYWVKGCVASMTAGATKLIRQ